MQPKLLSNQKRVA